MKMLLIDNGFTLKMSGGDHHMIKVAQYWSRTNVVCFLIPRLGYNYVHKLLVGKIFVYNTLLENYTDDIIKVIILYIIRTLKTLFFNIRDQFDVIIASSHYPHDVIPAIIFRLRNPKSNLVVYLHGISIPADNILRRIISTVYNIFGLLLSIKYANLIFVVNSSTRKYLLHQGIESERVVVTTNGVEVKEIVNLRERKIFDACFLGRLVKSKGIYDLLCIWKIVCSKLPNARLAILGDGPERESLEKLIFKTGLTANITLFGFVIGDEKYRILKSSKVFIFPSYLESWGISIAEAMACGLPVIAYDLPIYKEIFDDKLVIVPLGDINAMAKKVISFLENPQIAENMGEANRIFIKRYDWRVVAERELSAILGLK
jgi:glycosyltransferase involved in cell wall biosynthesis